MTTFKKGEAVKINTPAESLHGEIGIIQNARHDRYRGYDVAVRGGAFPYSVEELQRFEKFKTGDLVSIRRTGNIVSVVRYAPLDGGLPIVIVEADRWGDNYQFPVYERDLEETK